ncbi:MAG: Omp28-related outer membrane protein [Alistipes sp.]|nr:Omp28-related outer membrane protein [Alistipes sp.]
MKITKFFALMCAAIGFVACEPTNTNEPAPEVTGSITLEASSTTVELGESVTFTATMKDAETGETTDVTAYVSIYDSELNKISNPWTPSASGSYTFNATYGAESSNNVTITVMAQMPEVPADPQPANTKFNHRVVLIDHTGVNCPNCPLMTDNLLALAETDWHNSYNEVTCHAGGYASGDPANSTAANSLDGANKNYIKGYPTTVVNFGDAILENYQTSYFVQYAGQALTKLIKTDGADVGISMAVTGDSTGLYCAAQVKSAVAQEYKVVAWLLESGIYSPNQAGASKDYHRIYNYALRNISGTYSKTNVQGESIGVLAEGQTYDCAFELPITSTKWKYENMGVLVIVSAKDSNNSWAVVNSLYCSLNDGEKTYEYLN